MRELGTLKALGWTQRMVVRQIAGESLAQGALGGVLGIGLGVVAALAINAFGPTLDRERDDGRRRARVLGLGSAAHRDELASSLTAPVGARRPR